MYWFQSLLIRIEVRIQSLVQLILAEIYLKKEVIKCKLIKENILTIINSSKKKREELLKVCSQIRIKENLSSLCKNPNILKIGLSHLKLIILICGFMLISSIFYLNIEGLIHWLKTGTNRISFNKCKMNRKLGS